jgi:hypothetical protein
MQIRLKELFEIKTGKGVTSKDIVKGGKYPIISGGVTPMGYINVNLFRISAYCFDSILG